MIDKLIPDTVKYFLKRFWVVRKYRILIHRKARVDLNTFFEGGNSVGKASEVYKARIGFGTYIANNTTIRKTKIGKYCAIGDNVRTFLGQHPTKEFVSVHPAFFSTAKQAGFTFIEEQLFEEHKYIDEKKKYVVEIGNDVWIGNNVMIMDGVRIGDGAVIAAGSIVTKNVEPYSIVGGIPAKSIGKRFLLKFKWWGKGYKWIKRNSKYFTSITKFIEVCGSNKTKDNDTV